MAGLPLASDEAADRGGKRGSKLSMNFEPVRKPEILRSSREGAHNGGTPQMDRERWRHVETLYHTTLARPARERSAFLAEACAADEWL